MQIVHVSCFKCINEQAGCFLIILQLEILRSSKNWQSYDHFSDSDFRLGRELHMNFFVSSKLLVKFVAGLNNSKSHKFWRSNANMTSYRTIWRHFDVTTSRHGPTGERSWKDDAENWCVHDEWRQPHGRPLAIRTFLAAQRPAIVCVGRTGDLVGSCQNVDTYLPTRTNVRLSLRAVVSCDRSRRSM